MVGRFPNETPALVMVFSLLEVKRMKWQKVGMRAGDIAWIAEASKALVQEPIKLELLEEAKNSSYSECVTDTQDRPVMDGLKSASSK